MNELLEVFDRHVVRMDDDGWWSWDYRDRAYGIRNEYTRTHSWAVPNDQALEAIAAASPDGLVDMGAGTGYWSMLLRERGVTVRPYDIRPGHNHWASGVWLPMSRGGPSKLVGKLSDYGTLLLVWPPYKSPMAARSLANFRGHTLCYVGEGSGGCTADWRFFYELGEDPIAFTDNCPVCGRRETFECDHAGERTGWHKDVTVDIPQWPGMHDYLTIYRRT